MGHVPTRYHGLWQRRLYAEPADGEAKFVDRDTQVYWLQAGNWHADLRVPADRPDFSGVASLDDCSRGQLVWLASQTAFAGLTRVEGAYCTWHRLIDLSPGLDNDIGVMRFIDADTLEERHPEGRYRETWGRAAAADDAGPDIRFDASGLVRWIASGRVAMRISPRVSLDSRHPLLDDPAALETGHLQERVSLAIDHAIHDGNQWRVALSTRPWTEGRHLTDPGGQSIPD